MFFGGDLLRILPLHRLLLPDQLGSCLMVERNSDSELDQRPILMDQGSCLLEAFVMSLEVEDYNLVVSLHWEADLEEAVASRRPLLAAVADVLADMAADRDRGTAVVVAADTAAATAAHLDTDHLVSHLP